MKTIGLFSILFFTSLFLSGQDKSSLVKINYAEKIIKPKWLFIDANITDGQLSVLYREQELFHVYKYSQNLKEVSKRSFSCSHSSHLGVFTVLEIVSFGNKNWILSKVNNKIREEYHYYVQEIDLKNGVLVGKPVKLLTINSYTIKDLRLFELEKSFSNEKILFKYYSAGVKKKKFICGALVLSPNWKPVKHIRISLPKKTMKEGAVVFELDAADSLVATRTSRAIHEQSGKKYDKTTSVSCKNGALEESTYKYPNYGETIRAQLIFQTKSRFKTENENVILGLYNDSLTSQTAGIGYYKENYQSDSAYKLVLNEFEKEHLKSDGNGIYRNSMVILDGNDYYLIAEKSKIEKFYYTTGEYETRGYYKYETTFLNIVIAKISNTGDLLWLVDIPKKSFLGGEYYNNPNLAKGIYAGNIYILFTYYEGKFYSGPKSSWKLNPNVKGDVYLAKIDCVKGTVEDIPLFSQEEKNQKKFSIVKHVNGTNRFIIRRKVGGGFRYGIISIK